MFSFSQFTKNKISIPYHFLLGEKTNSDIKTTPIPILGKIIFSVTRNLLFEYNLC